MRQKRPIASERANPKIAYENNCCFSDGFLAYPMIKDPNTDPIPAPDPAFERQTVQSGKDASFPLKAVPSGERILSQISTMGLTLNFQGESENTWLGKTERKNECQTRTEDRSGETGRSLI